MISYARYPFIIPTANPAAKLPEKGRYAIIKEKKPVASARKLDVISASFSLLMSITPTCTR